MEYLNNFNSDVNAESIPFDAEIEAARQQYCECSGKPLCKVDANTVQDLLTIHGRETTLKILYTQQKQVSLEWIWLNDDGLAKLAIHRPKEYFVYAASKLLQNVTIHSELMRLHEAAEAWRNLQSFDDDLMSPINEIIRRLLANFNLQKLTKRLSKFKCKRVNEITQTIESFTAFQIELQNLLETLVQAKKRADMQAKGMTAFRMQGMISALSELEIAVGIELNDFDLIEGKSIDAIHAITGTRYRHENRKENSLNKFKDKIKYSQKPIIEKKPGKIILKIGGNI